MSMMPLRVAMPNKVMNPTSEAIDSVPPDRKTITTTTNQSQGQVCHYQQGRANRFQGDIKQQEDTGDRDNRQEQNLA